MKKILFLMFALILTFVGFGQDLTPVVTESTPWYATGIAISSAIGILIVLLEWIINYVPTSKPAKGLIGVLIVILKWIKDRVPNRIKESKK